MHTDRKIRLLTSHGAILLLLAHRPRSTVAGLARDVGLTQRQVLRVLADLVREGYVRVETGTDGRRYEVVPGRALDGRPVFEQLQVADLLAVVEPLSRALDSVAEE